jgi:hypothetical protein
MPPALRLCHNVISMAVGRNDKRANPTGMIAAQPHKQRDTTMMPNDRIMMDS